MTPDQPNHCPFCDELASGEALRATRFSAVLRDNYPLAPGHLLVVPLRHVAHITSLSAPERADLWALVTESLPHASDATIGVNDGPSAGQTVPHVHVHVIPRTHGDVPDPRGGIRNVFPSSVAHYWQESPA